MPDAAPALSPIAAVKTAYAAIRAYDDPACFIPLRPEEDVLAEARALEAAGPDGKPLFGLTFAVKDNIDVVDLPTTAACPDFAYVAQRSAFVVERLVAAGVVRSPDSDGQPPEFVRGEHRDPPSAGRRRARAG